MKEAARPEGCHWTFNTQMLSEGDFTLDADSPAVPHTEVIRLATQSNRFDNENYRANLGRTVRSSVMINQATVLGNAHLL